MLPQVQCIYCKRSMSLRVTGSVSVVIVLLKILGISHHHLKNLLASGGLSTPQLAVLWDYVPLDSRRMVSSATFWQA